MADPFQRSDWYDQSLPPALVPGQTATKRREHPVMKATSIVVCVLLLIVASVYAFSDRGDPIRFVPDGEPRAVVTEPPARNGGDGDASGDAEGEFRSFVDEYYSSASGSTSLPPSALARAEGDPSVSVQLVSAEGRQELSLQELYRKNIGSLVGIKAYSAERSSSYAWGSGIVLTEDGYIVTNQHIIAEALKASVVLADGSEYPAFLIGEDTQTDIAVLKIDARGLTPAEFGDSGALAVGDRVAAIGNPLGDQLSGTMTDGIISAIDRSVQSGGRTMTLLQTNAALNEGNSGGPLINMYGQVVGITNMKMSNRYRDVTVEGLGFAIPSVTVKTVADQLIARGEVAGRPGLGITVGKIPAEAEEELGPLPEGLFIVSVSEGSDAREKGVQPGDILTHVNGQPVTETSDVLAIRDTLSIGDSMVLTLWRNGASFDVTIILRDLNKLY